MNVTRTARPGKTQTVQGRGRGRGNPTTRNNMEPGVQTGPVQHQAQGGRGVKADGEDAPEPGQMQRREAYSVIAPDPAKREKILTQAKKEEEQYKKHKENQKRVYVSYHGSVGGGEISRAEAVNRNQTLLRTQTSTKKFGAKAAYKKSVQQKEQEEIDKKKAEARRKTEENKKREADRQKKLDEERQKTNSKFLDSLEKKKSSSNPSHKVVAATKGVPAESMLNSPAADNATCVCDLSNTIPHELHSTSQLQELISMFPQEDPSKLEDMLHKHNQNLELIANLLLEGN